MKLAGSAHTTAAIHPLLHRTALAGFCCFLLVSFSFASSPTWRLRQDWSRIFFCLFFTGPTFDTNYLTIDSFEVWWEESQLFWFGLRIQLRRPKLQPWLSNWFLSSKAICWLLAADSTSHKSLTSRLEAPPDELFDEYFIRWHQARETVLFSTYLATSKSTRSAENISNKNQLLMCNYLLPGFVCVAWPVHELIMRSVFLLFILAFAIHDGLGLSLDPGELTAALVRRI